MRQITIPDPRHLDPPPDMRGMYSLRALGRGRLPETIALLDGLQYSLIKTAKHDFYACTGFYQAADGRKAVVKMGRVEQFMGFDFKWLGKRLRNREVRFYKKLACIPNVPRFLGLVGETGFAHEYVPGRPLEKGKPIPDGFFSELHQLLEKVHSHNMAYVDTNKPQNILLGDDNRPHLIDFQISFDPSFFNCFLTRWILHMLQREDIYHIRKHQRRMRPDEMSPALMEQAQRKSIFIRVHRRIARPYFIVRRAMFRKWRNEGRLLPEGSK